MKKKLIFGLLALFLLITPTFAACKKAANTPPPPPNNFNNQAEAKLDEVFSFDFFPFDLVDVIELTFDNDDSTLFCGFKFKSSDFEEFKIQLSQNLSQNAFSQKAGAFVYAKTINEFDYTISISITEEEDVFVFKFTKEQHVKSDIEIFEEKVESLLGFKIVLPDGATLENFTSENITENSISCDITNVTYEALTEALASAWEENNLPSIDDYSFAFFEIEGKSYILLITEGESSITFSLTLNA